MMTPEEINALVEYNRRACHAHGCRNPAEYIYWWEQRNAHGGTSEFHSQRCFLHPVDKAYRVEPFAAAPTPGASEP